MTLRMFAAAGLSLMLLSPLAHAATCSDVVVDQAGVISDPGKVAKAAAELGNTGVTVRVRTVSVTVPNGQLDNWALGMRRECPEWAQGDSWKSTLVLLVYAPTEKRQIGLYFGVSESARLGGGKWQDVLRDRFVPQVKAAEQGDKAALTVGFVNVLQALEGLIAPSSVGSGGVTINQGTDYSGVLKGFLFVLIIVAVFAVLVSFVRYRGRRQAAQAEAMRIRAKCIAGILEISDATALMVLRTKVGSLPAGEYAARSQQELERYQRLADQALEAFNEFDKLGGGDPNAAKLSAEAYDSNRRSYQQILANYIAPAQRIAKTIDEGGAWRDEHPRNYQPPAGYAAAEQAASDREDGVDRAADRRARYAEYETSQRPLQAPLPPTVVVNQGGPGGDGFLTGFLAGDILGSMSSESRERRRSRDRDDDGAVGSPGGGGWWSSDGDSGSGSKGGSSDSGGSYSVDTSGPSDSGGSFSADSGSSGGDSGGSSSSC